MKKVFIAKGTTEAIEAKGQVVDGVVAINCTATSQMVRYVPVEQIVPLLAALNEAIHWCEFPDLKSKWKTVLKTYLESE